MRAIGAFYLALTGLRIALSISAPEKLALTSARQDVVLYGVLTALTFVVGFGLLRANRWVVYVLVVYFALDVFSFVLRKMSPLHPWILIELLFVIFVVSSLLAEKGMRRC